MGWFNKKKEKEVPSLLELPKLPELPKIEENYLDDSKIHQLPTFPTNPLGEKFSQNTIKEAIAGKKEGEEVFEADDFENEDIQMMQRPLKKNLIPEFSNLEKIKGIPFEKRREEISENIVSSTKKIEPVFIRIDKFEESLKIFDKTKEKISEIESMLRNIKHIKENEEKELKSWEEEIDTIKQQIEKVDKNIFSKIE